MENKNFNTTIEVSKTATEAFNGVNSVSKWWTEDFEGSSQKQNDVFTVHFGKTFATHKLVEVVPNKKVVWRVTDCYLDWLKDKKEWMDTSMSFEISTKGGKTLVSFTHIGLVPQVECYNDCVKGWGQCINQSLFKLITEGKGQPEKKVTKA